MIRHGLSDSLEDYLETILALEKANKVARVKDIADQMGVMPGSVTGALKALAHKALVNYEPYSYITLTEKGKAIALEIARRHEVIKDFLQCVLMLDPQRAEDNACRMEHAMDKTAVDRLIQFIEYVHSCPRAGKDWVEAFVHYYTKENSDADVCEQCLSDCLERYRRNK